MTMPVGLNNPGRFHDLPFAEKLPENIALLSEIMFKKDGKPLTVQEHHILLSERQKKGESMGDVLMYTAAASALEFKIPVEEFILKQPYYAGRFFYGAIQKAVREKKFSAKRFVPYWKGIDNATRREVGRVERVVVQDGMFILWGVECSQRRRACMMQALLGFCQADLILAADV